MILITFGTRPEYIKLKPLIKAIDGKIPYKTLFTGQHQDIAPKNADFNLDVADYPGNRLDSILKIVYLYQIITLKMLHTYWCKVTPLQLLVWL